MRCAAYCGRGAPRMSEIQRRGPDASFDIGYVRAHVPKSQPPERTPAQKAEGQRTIASNIEVQAKVVREHVTAMKTAAAAADLAGWTSAKCSADAGVAELQRQVEAAVAAATETVDVQVRKRLAAAPEVLTAAKELVAGAPAVPKPRAPVLGCADVLLAVLPPDLPGVWREPAFKAAELAIKAIFRSHMTSSDITAFRAIIREHEKEEIARRFSRFGDVRRQELLRYLSSDHVKWPARARDAAQRQAARDAAAAGPTAATNEHADALAEVPAEPAVDLHPGVSGETVEVLAAEPADPDAAMQGAADPGSGAVAKRHAAWQAEAAPLTHKLGVAPAILANDEARTRSDAHGARGLAEGNVVYLHPERLTPGTSEGRLVLIHELVHIAQAQGGSASSREAAEAEADAIAHAAASGAEITTPQRSIALDRAAADSDAKRANEKPTQEAAPELPASVPYQWLPGTYATWIRAAWFTSAPDFSQDGRWWVSPARVSELLRALQGHGMLAWVAPEIIQRAASALGIEYVAGAKVFKVDLGASVFHELGLPPGTSAVVGREHDGLRVVVAAPGARVAYGETLPLSPALADQVVGALEGFTGLPIKGELRDTLRSGRLTATLGAGTISYPLERATCDRLFGAEAYKTWLTKPRTGHGTAQFGAAGGAQSFADLTPDEVAYIQRWFKDHLQEGKGHEPPTMMSRALLDALRKIDAHPLKTQILGSLHGGHTAGLVTPITLDRALQEAEFESARQKAGLAPQMAARTERTPVFDTPIPFRIDQQNGRVVAGEKVRFTLAIDWPAEFDCELRSEYTWRPKAAEVDWTFERTLPGGATQIARSHAITHGDHEGIDHVFQLEPGEVSAIWTVTAFVRHNFFRPGIQPTLVEVKTYETRVQETRDQAFADLGMPAIEDDDYDFSTSLFNEVFGSHDQDHGRRFRGELPKDFAGRTPEQRTKSLDEEIGRNQQLLAYLRKDHASSAATESCEHYLAKLAGARRSLGNDLHDGWQPFEVRGSFLGRDNQMPDGPLDLQGAVNWIPLPAGTPLVMVQLRDLSRKLAADNYRFEGSGQTYEAALEAAFVELCKRYPGGKISLLAEGFEPSGKQPTGKTVGFELATGTAWKDVKEKVFDPAVNVIVNVGSAMLMIFVPATIPVLLPLTIAYNETQTVDQLAQAWDDGTLTPSKGAVLLSQVGLDLMPLLGRAPVFRASRRAFAVFEGFQVGTQALVMTLQAQQMIRNIRDQDIQGMARLYEDYVALERSTQQSDPHLQAMEHELDERANAIRQRSLEVWIDLVKQQAIAFIPVRAATHLEHRATAARIADLGETARFVHQDGVDPHYDPQRGQIVGDQRKLDLNAVRTLTKAQDAHMRAVASLLADELGVSPDQLHLDAGDQTRIWKDGDRIEVRYQPGTDPAAAVASWQADAAKAHIGAPAHAQPRPHADVDGPLRVETPHVDARTHVRPEGLPTLSAQVGAKVVIDPALHNGVEVHATQRKGLLGYDMTGVEIRVGTSALTSDVLAHARIVEGLRRYNGLLGKLRLLAERLFKGRGGGQRSTFPPGSRGYLTETELGKLGELIDARQAQHRDGLIDEATLFDEVAFLQGEVAFHTETLQSMADTGYLHDDAIVLGGPDIGVATRAAQAHGYKLPGEARGVGDHANPSHYYYRRAQHDATEFELARSPSAPADVVAYRARVVNGQFQGLEDGAAPVPKEVVPVELSQAAVVARLRETEGFGKYAEMLEAQGIASRAAIDAAITTLRERKNRAGDGVTLEWLRDQVKELFRDDVTAKLVDPTLDGAASYRNMRAMLDGLANADRGVLAEIWYRHRYAPTARPQVKYRVTRTSGDNAGKIETRAADLVVGREAREVKDIEGKIDEEQFGAYVDELTRPEQGGARAFDTLRYVFTKPGGAIANLEFIADKMMWPALQQRLTVEVFDRQGVPHVATTSKEVLQLLAKLRVVQ